MFSRDSFASFQGISQTYIEQGCQSLQSRRNQFTKFLGERKFPEKGWDGQTMKIFLEELSAMDSNNFQSSVGFGEREGRVFSSLVSERHFHLAHGVGRSGDVTAVQPKAAGSSVLVQVGNSAINNLIKQCGIPSSKASVVLPVATGMAVGLVLSSIRLSTGRNRILWIRCDQKSIPKSITTFGMELVVVENVFDNDEIRTDINSLKSMIDDTVCAVISTSSCFAPRAVDRVVEVAELCKEKNVHHIINNAYGIQSKRISSLIQEATIKGRVDAFVQSTDKNFLVPVGGSIVSSSQRAIVSNVSKIYPGRASMSPLLDLVLTLLAMGTQQYLSLRDQQKDNHCQLRKVLERVAQQCDERVLKTPNNPISLAMSLSCSTDKESDYTQLGSMLFQRGISGTRVVVGSSSTTTIYDWKPTGFGSHMNNGCYPNVPYLTCAASIGLTTEDITKFEDKLLKTVNEWKSSLKRVS